MEGYCIHAGRDRFANPGEHPRESELTFGVGVKIQRLRLGTELTSHFVGFPFLKGSAEFDLSEVFSVGGEGYYGQRNTMRELRECPLGPGAVGFVKAKL